MHVEIDCHPADLRSRAALDMQSRDQFVHAAGGDAGEAAVDDDRDQGGFRTFTAFEKSLGNVGAGAEVGDGDLSRTDAGVEAAVATAMALSSPVGG